MKLVNPFRIMRKHLEKWKGLYEVFGILLAIITSFLAVGESRKAIELTNKSVQLQQEEFTLRNRPYLILTNPKFGGKITNTDTCTKQLVIDPESVHIELRNIADVPATKVKSVGHLFIDGVKVTECVISQSACVKGDARIKAIGIASNIVDKVKSEEHRFEIEMTTTYYGMLGQNKPHKTFVKIRYYPTDKAFKQVKLDLE